MFSVPDCRPKIDSDPISNLKREEPREANHSFLMFFQRHTPYGPKTSQVHHPPCVLPYLLSITCLQGASLSKPYLHSHFPIKARLNNLKFLIARPSKENGWHIRSELTNGTSSPPPYHPKGNPSGYDQYDEPHPLELGIRTKDT